MLIAHISEATIRDAIVEVGGPEADAVVIVGTDLAMSRVAAMAEFWIGKPVVALNIATYWHALRTCGIDDHVQASGGCQPHGCASPNLTLPNSVAALHENYIINSTSILRGIDRAELAASELVEGSTLSSPR